MQNIFLSKNPYKKTVSKDYLNLYFIWYLNISRSIIFFVLFIKESFYTLQKECKDRIMKKIS